VLIKHHQKAYDRDLGAHVWGIPGGGIEGTDQSPLDAAKRETLDETGLSIPTATEICVFTQRVRCKTSPGGFKKGRLHLFWAILDDLESKFRPFESEEIEETRLVTRPEIVGMKDVFLLAHLRLVFAHINHVDLGITPVDGHPLSLEVNCPTMGLKDRDFTVP
jgi:ADP-ribose pyrophosphatase YjhB (NUDIX family)